MGRGHSRQFALCPLRTELVPPCDPLRRNTPHRNECEYLFTNWLRHYKSTAHRDLSREKFHIDKNVFASLRESIRTFCNYLRTKRNKKLSSSIPLDESQFTHKISLFGSRLLYHNRGKCQRELCGVAGSSRKSVDIRISLQIYRYIFM